MARKLLIVGVAAIAFTVTLFPAPTPPASAAPDCVGDATVTSGVEADLATAFANATASGTDYKICIGGTYLLTAELEYDAGPNTTLTLEGLGEDASGAVLDGQSTVRIVTHGGDGDESFIVDNITFQNGGNAAASSGGAINAIFQTVTVTNSVFTSNETSLNGGAIRAGGVSISNSTFTGNESASGDGGAIFATGGNTVVTDSTFTDNEAVGADGGAIFASGGVVAIANTTFTVNTAGGDGGALWYAAGGDVDVSGSTFTDNSAQGVGGAITLVLAGDFAIEDSTFTDNEAAGDGGAIRYSGTGDTTIQDSTFTSNESMDDGGAAYVDTGGDPDSDVTITGSTFTQNEATVDQQGGAIATDGFGGAFTIEDSLFEANRTNDDRGGALDLNATDGASLTVHDTSFIDNRADGDNAGGAMDFSGFDSATFLRTVFDGNVSTDGGGAFHSGPGIDLKLQDSLFVDNEAQDWHGGAIYGQAPMEISGTTFASNRVTNGYDGGAINAGAGATIENSTFVGNAAIGGGTGNAIDARNRDIVLNHVTMGPDQDIWDAANLTTMSSVLDGCVVNNPIVSGGTNFDTDGACGLAGPGDISGASPGLLAPADNGGKTAGAPGHEVVIQTMLPTFLSPVINAAASLTEDQRGVARPFGPAPDIGATEWVYDPPADYDPFIDDDDSTFEGDIEWIAWHGITRGCNPPTNNEFCPETVVSRETFAAFLSRSLGLTEIDPTIDFVDVPDSNIFKNDILRLATAGITKGCNPPTNDKFCPDDDLLRETLAAFFVRTFGYEKIDPDLDYVDVAADSTFRNDILKLGTAGVTRGCNPPVNDEFCPKDQVRRDTMAAFLKRALRPGG